MASWKKVLVSGSNIEVNNILATGNITASLVPTTNNEDNILVIGTDGAITQMGQGNISGTNPTFNINASNTPISISLSSSVEFSTGVDLMVFDAASNHGFGFEVSDSDNTASIDLITPQGLKTSDEPQFRNMQLGSAADTTGFLSHQGDTNTRIGLSDDEISLEAGGVKMVTLIESEDFPNVVLINSGGIDVDFIVESNTDTHLLFADGGNDKVAIGTDTVNAHSLLTVAGTIHTTGITASLLPINTTSAHVIVSGANGLEKRDIQPLIDDSVAALTGSITASIIGTANEIIVDTTVNGDTQIGIVDNAIIGGGLTVKGDISASNIHAAGNITGSNLRVENDIAIGGNLFSFTGLSLIENVAAIFTGSNIFGQGGIPSANDTAGGGTAHQFTGSVGITGSALTITDGNLSLGGSNNGNISTTNGSVTANSGTGSFGYVHALEISASGHLYAEIPTTQSLTQVVVYKPETGQLFRTASNTIGVTEYPDLNNIPDLIVSGAIALVESTQGEYDLTVDSVTVSDGVSAGLLTGDSPTFNNLGLTNSLVLFGNISASKNISASGHLIASLSLDNSPSFKTVVYNTTTGKFFHTGSYGGSGGGLTSYTALDNIPVNIVSSSAFSSNNQGGVTASINGVTSSFDVGLLPTDNPTFATVTTTGNASVGGALTVTGNLTVNGTTTTINVDNLSIEDRFILLASGAAVDTSAGIVVSRAANGNGTALFWDSNTDMWSIDLSGADPDASTYGTATGDLKLVTVFQDTSLPSQPGIAAEVYGNSEDNNRGQLFVDTTNSDLYVYL